MKAFEIINTLHILQTGVFFIYAFICNHINWYIQLCIHMHILHRHFFLWCLYQGKNVCVYRYRYICMYVCTYHSAIVSLHWIPWALLLERVEGKEIQRAFIYFKVVLCFPCSLQTGRRSSRCSGTWASRQGWDVAIGEHGKHANSTTRNPWAPAKVKGIKSCI